MRTKPRDLTSAASIAVLLLAPLALGAKGGCSHAVVGDDGSCKTAECGEAGMDGTTGGSMATGGSTSTGGGHTTGGSNATGGGPAQGGSMATGGGPAHGGSGGGMATGGSTTTGGGPTTGGTSGAMATGGGPAHGGSGGVGGAPPGEVCGGRLGPACPAGQFCDFSLAAICGFADATGNCAVMPDACDTIYHPVCGCDGMTYSNACFANLEGTAVQKDGACETPPGTTCAGLHGTQCAAGEFCDFTLDAMCGAGDQTGTCAPIPDTCTTDDQPVCGCDDTTYSNACDAHAHGVAVAADGECGAAAPSCGGIAAVQCPSPKDYCDFDIATRCGSSDQGGTCKPKPTGCTDQYDPVCGCDGKTYGNACDAAAAGVSVQAAGEC